LRCGECEKVLAGKPNDYPEIEVEEGKRTLYCIDCADGWIKAQQGLNNEIGERIIEHIDKGEATGNLLEDVEQALANLSAPKAPAEMGLGQILAIIQGELAKIDAGAEIDPEGTFLTILTIIDGEKPQDDGEEE